MVYQNNEIIIDGQGVAVLLPVVQLPPNKINGEDIDQVKNRVNFEDLTPLYPDSRFKLEQEKPMPDLTERIIDIIAPLGKGQRQLIVAQPSLEKLLLCRKSQML